MAWTLHVVFALQPDRWTSGLPSIQRYVGVSQDEQSTGWSMMWSIKRGVRESVGRAEVHGQLHASAQHFLDVPMPRHLIRTSACDDNVAFHVLDRVLVSVCGAVRFEKDQAMEDQ